MMDRMMQNFGTLGDSETIRATAIFISAYSIDHQIHIKAGCTTTLRIDLGGEACFITFDKIKYLFQ